MVTIVLIVSMVLLEIQAIYQDNNREEVERINPAIGCKSNQFYYTQQMRCRNCSDLTQLFLGYQGWLSDEVTNNIANNANTNTKIININTTTGTYHNSIRDQYQSSRTRQPAQDSEILSRLVVTTPIADSDIIDSISSDPNEHNQDSDNNIYDSMSLDSTSFSTSRDDSSSFESVHAARQTLKIIDSFIRQSPLIGDELLNAIDQCRRYQNVTACHFWSNMCVMTMYSYSDQLATSSSAGSYQSRHPQTSDKLVSYDSISDSVDREISTNPDRQWQQCKQFSIYTICDSLRAWHRVEKQTLGSIQNVYALDEPLAKFGSSFSYKLNQAIQLLAYRYSYNGQLISIEQFGIDDMGKFCLLADNNNPIARGHDFVNHIRLSGNLRLRCNFDNLPMLASSSIVTKPINETVFIDLFIAYPLNGAMLVRPVPILVKSLNYNGVQINRKYQTDSNRCKLVYRFVLQSVIGFDSNHKRSASTKHNRLFLLYVKTAILEFKFQRNDKSAFLTSALLILDHGVVDNIDKNSSENSKLLSLTSQISIEQKLINMPNQKKDIDLSLTIICILGSVWSLIKCYNIQKCHGIVKLDLVLLLKFLLINCDTLSNILATVTLFYLSYMFLLLKIQSSVHILAPSEELDNAHLMNIQLAFVLKLIGMIFKLYCILNADVFFIDWEKPRMLTSSQILSHQSNNVGLTNRDQTMNVNETGFSTSVNMQDNRQIQTGSYLPSFWRPYCVVNRWLQLQTLRYQDITVQLLAFTCLIELTNLHHFATSDIYWTNQWAQPEHNGSYQAPKMAPCINNGFKLLIYSFVYLTLSMVQILIKRYIFEPMFRNTIHEFVDLCSVANVSVFCMIYPRFGYYIHGRNANGSGDCGIIEMNLLLEREERNLCSKRGLTPNSDQQTFVLILPRIINDHYRKLLVTNDLNLFSQSQNGSHKPLANISGNQLKQHNKAAATTHGSSFLKMALNLPVSSTSFAINKTAIDTLVARNRAINTFLTNFLNHIYKDIDYKVRPAKKLHCLLFEADLDNEGSSLNERPLSTLHDKSAAATFCIDCNNSFTSLFWSGLELDWIVIELLATLTFDIWFDQPLPVTTALIWLLHQGFKMLYEAYSRQNLINKALVDEKFLLKRC